MIEDSTRTMDSDEEVVYHTSTADAETLVTAPDLHRMSIFFFFLKSIRLSPEGSLRL